MTLLQQIPVRCRHTFWLLLLVAFAALLLFAGQALADDVTAPQVLALSMSTTHFDTSSSDQTIGVTVTLSDDQSGVDSASWELYMPDSAQPTRIATLTRVSGDLLASTWIGSIVMPKGSPGGVWLAALGVSDSAGNYRGLLAPDLESLFGVDAVRVTNEAATFDGNPPQVTSFSLTPSHIDTEDGDQAVTLTVTISEEGTGLDVVGAHLSPLSVGQPQYSFLLRRISGDDLHAVYSGTATIPKGSRGGTWGVLLWASDFAGNTAYRWPSDLATLFGAENVQVVNDAPLVDETPPTVVAFSMTPTEFDTSSGPQTLTLRVTVADDSAGVEKVYGQIMPLIGMRSVDLNPLRVSGDDRLAVYECTVTVPWLAKEGIWRPRLYVEDKLGNGRWLEPFMLDQLVPDAPGLILINTATADQVTVDSEWTLENGLNTVTFPAGTVVTRRDGGSFAFYRMTAQPFVIDDRVPTTDLDGQPIATLMLGIPGLNLAFSQPVTISLEVGHAYDGRELSIQSLGEGQEAWANETSRLVVDGRVQFTVGHATRFVASLRAPVAPGPALSKLSRTSGRRGMAITLSGKYFGSRRGTSCVKFGTAKVTRYLAWSKTRIKCRVPARARFGRLKITVVTTRGKSNAKTFAVKR